MAYHSSGQRLPPELIHAAFGYLYIGSLIRVAHVCKSWRNVAFEHPGFWRSIIVDSTEPAALNVVAFRLDKGRRRPIALYIEIPEMDPRVRTHVIPILRDAVPRARILEIQVESLFHLEVETVLVQNAPYLEKLRLEYTSVPLPDLHLTMPLGKGLRLLDGSCNRLRSVRLYNIILPQEPIPAFMDVEEVWFMHALSTFQEEFPCYLFDFFPQIKRLRLQGGDVYFTNAPLPASILERFASLDFLDIAFKNDALPAFFRHLPIDRIPEVHVTAPDEDSLYDALTPLRSPFQLCLTQPYPEEFLLSVRCGQSQFSRHFPEAFSYYFPGSTDTNALLQNLDFIAQLASLTIQTSLWPQLRPWLPPFPALALLTVDIDDEGRESAGLPTEPIAFPALKTLVIRARNARIGVQEIVDFAERLTATWNTLSLQLRGVVVDSGWLALQTLRTHFASVTVAAFDD